MSDTSNYNKIYQCFVEKIFVCNLCKTNVNIAINNYGSPSELYFCCCNETYFVINNNHVSAGFKVTYSNVEYVIVYFFIENMTFINFNSKQIRINNFCAFDFSEKQLFKKIISHILL